VFQCVAVSCSVLQCAAVCFRIGSILVCCSVLQCVAVCCRVLQYKPSHMFPVDSVLQCVSVAVCCSVLQCLLESGCRECASK